MINLLILFANVGDPCVPDHGGFLGFPTWYKYLEGVQATNGATGVSECVVKIQNINDTWLIVAALMEILLRVAALAAIVMVITGGVQYITSEGSPDKTKKALNTILMAVIGLVITIGSAALVSFVAGRFN